MKKMEANVASKSAAEKAALTTVLTPLETVGGAVGAAPGHVVVTEEHVTNGLVLQGTDTQVDAVHED